MKKPTNAYLKGAFIVVLFILLLPFLSFESYGQIQGKLSMVSVTYLKFDQENKDIVQDSVRKFKQLSKMHADSLQAEEAVYYAKKYIRSTKDLSIINDHFFDKINQTDVYLNFKSRYKSQFNFLSIFYLFAGLLGLFIFIILNLKKGISRSSTLLMSLFVLFHSLFILHLSLYLINCHYYFPHTLLISTSFTLLYGPLIYFYFRMTSTHYQLRWYDTLHLLPAITLLVYILPFYKKTSIEKFIILFDQEDILLSQANFIIAAKIISLVAYAVLTLNLYRSAKNNVEQKSNKLLWQRNIIAIYFVYVVAFIIYITITSGYIDDPVFFHLQIFVMVGLVFYVAYITYAQPEIFKGDVILVDLVDIFKYKKSGLTKSFSNELKTELIKLMEEEKVFKRNNVNLDTLSEMLGTTRHNTSQVINEHFQMNFFDLINKFRIEEALLIIKRDTQKKLNIIDIAYEVGYNNKVTFNKSFKKIQKVTPSQYIKSLNI